MDHADLSLNQTIADRLREAADVLQQQGANPYRINAYRHGADTLTRLDRDVAEILRREGREGLEALPGVGPRIAAAIEEMVRTGTWSQLERLRGTLDPVPLFQTVPGIGPGLARSLHDHLHLESLEALEMAAHDGRLESVPGIGPRRAAAIRAALEGMLRRARPPRRAPAEEPDVATVLEVDQDYRRQAEAGRLPTIAPRRFNPGAEPWLPVLHTQRGDWHFTALYSNTARAHELGRTRDWVVLYFFREHGEEGQRTVVSETRGPLAGRRVVRGREAECRAHYTRCEA